MNQLANAGVSGVMRAAVATGLFVSRATFVAPSGVTTDAGQPDDVYTPVAGLTGVRCMSMPFSEARILATETKTLEEVMAMAPRHVLLDGYFPQIPTGERSGWRVILDGVENDLLSAESDSQSVMTRLSTRVVGI